MARAAAVVAVGVLVPAALIGFRLLTQRWETSGPPQGSATIEGDRVLLASRAGGRLLELPVEEGANVTAGTVLARLDCTDPEAALAEALARLSSARAQANAAEATATAAGLGVSSATASSAAADAQARALAAQRDAASRQAKRVAALDDASATTLDQTASGAEALERQTEAASANARAAELGVGLARGQADAATLQALAAAEAVKAAEAAVRRAESLAAECVIVAPRDAVLETLPFTAGELVPPGAPIAAIVDLTVVHATFWLPNAELGAAEPGMAATLEADAWPGETFPATVRRVGSEAAFTPRNVQTRTDRDRLVYPVEVEAENPDGRLRPGMPVQVVLARP
jgi:HlyD family secretion protein